MNISLESNYNPSFWNTKLAGASTFICDDINSSFSVDIIGSWIEKYTIRRLTNQLVRETERINKILSSSITTPLTEDKIKAGAKAHKGLIELLDKFCIVEKIDISNIDNKSVLDLYNTTIEFFDSLKKLEQKMRVDLWPEDNELLFTYDELKDLYENQQLCN